MNGDTKVSELDLKHYGVIGMKWGVRRAYKKGKPYTYKSHGQKKYEKKLDRQMNKGVSAKRMAKTRNKLEQYKTRDISRVDYATRTSVGKSVVKTMLFGPFGSGNYNRMRASGAGRIGSAFVANWVASTVGYPITALYTKHRENKMAKRTNRINYVRSAGDSK